MRILSRLFLFLPLLLASCNPATPPTPPAELPSALIFPRSVAIDVTKVQSASGASSLAALVGAGGEFSDIIAAGADTADAVSDVIDEILAVFDEMEIPVGTEVTTFETDLAETINGIDTVLNVKIDFGDYDLDGDGQTEGCDGHTASTPICIRLWVDERRTLAAIFNAYPTVTNPGAGEIRLGLSANPNEVGGTDLMTTVIFDYLDDEDKSTEFLSIGETSGLDEEDLPAFFSGRITIGQTGPDETAEKIINLTADLGEGEEEITASLGYVGQWLEDDDYWSGSTDAMLDGATASFSNVCAQISTGNEADRDICLGLGIDVEGIDFVTAPAASDAAFPDNFPAAPTF